MNKANIMSVLLSLCIAASTMPFATSAVYAEQDAEANAAVTSAEEGQAADVAAQNEADGAEHTEADGPLSGKEHNETDGVLSGKERTEADAAENSEGTHERSAKEGEPSEDVVRDTTLRLEINRALQELEKAKADGAEVENPRSVNAHITKADMEALEGTLSIHGDIKDFSGLELATNITGLHIESQNQTGGNAWINLRALSALTRLQKLEIANYNIHNVEVLRALTELQVLKLDYAGFGDEQIREIAAIAAVLSKLESLSLAGNHLSEVSVVMQLDNLQLKEINLANNHIMNMAGLDLEGTKFRFERQSLTLEVSEARLENPVRRANGDWVALYRNEERVTSGEAGFENQTITIPGFESMEVGGAPLTLLSKPVKLNENGVTVEFRLDIVKEAAPTTHQIIIMSMQGAQVALEPSGTLRKSGEVVTVHVTVNEPAKYGYTIVSDDEETLTVMKDQSYSFRMPSKDVTIQVELILKKYKLTAIDGELRKVSERVEVGTQIPLQAKGMKGHTFVKWVSDDKAWESTDAKATFTMPAHAVVVEAVYEPTQTEKPNSKQGGASSAPSAGGSGSSASPSGGSGGGGGSSAAPAPKPAAPTIAEQPKQPIAEASKVTQTIRLTIGSTEMIQTVGENERRLQADAAPFISEGRTMMPLRYIGEALGLKVTWDAASKTATLTDGENTILVPLNGKTMTVNGKAVESDVLPMLQNGREYLSISNIGKALGLEAGKQIQWNAETKEIAIVM